MSTETTSRRYFVAECFDRCRFGNFEVVDSQTQNRIAQCSDRGFADAVTTTLNNARAMAELTAATRRTIAAFEALGRALGPVANVEAHQECESALVAQKAALASASGDV